MLILLDAFAEMLDVKPEELQRAIRAGGKLGDFPLPAHQHLLGAMIMFDEAEALAFSRRWHGCAVSITHDTGVEPPVSLLTFATQAGIAPLALYQAVTSGRKLRGLMPPAPISTVPPLMFEPVAVSDFLKAFRGILKIN